MEKKNFDGHSRLQSACVKWFRYQHSDIKDLLFSIPNGIPLANKNVRTKIYNKLKEEGLQPGVPDLLLAVGNSIYNGMFIEIKSKTDRLRKKQVDIIDNSKLLNIDINELNFQDSQKIDDFINMYESSLKEFFEIKIKELLKDKKYNRCVNKFSTEELNNNIKKISEVILGDNTKNNIYFLNYDKKKDIYYLCCYEITIHYNCYQDKINNINKHVYVLNEYKKYEVPTKNILIEIGKEKCNWYRDSSLLGCSFTLYSGYFNNI